MADAATYRDTLHEWAARHLPSGAKVTAVQIEYNEGGAWSEMTFEDASLWVTIDYTVSGVPGSSLEDGDGAVKVLSDMGQLLTELFAIDAQSA